MHIIINGKQYKGKCELTFNSLPEDRENEDIKLYLNSYLYDWKQAKTLTFGIMIKNYRIYGECRYNAEHNCFICPEKRMSIYIKKFKYMGHIYE
jgi:hypothetical protein